MAGSPMKQITAADLTFRGKEETKFMREVYKGQLEWMKNRGSKYYSGVPTTQLVTVEGIFKMKKNAGEALKKLLKQARADLVDAKKSKDSQALKVTLIGISSTYRDLEKEKIAYINAFRIHYDGFLTRLYKKKGIRHGPMGVKAMMNRMINKKAPVGYGNHTSGIAVDFKTTEDGRTLGPSRSQAKFWIKSWLYKWLEKNDVKYGFRRLRTEQWHWDYVNTAKKP